MGIVTSSLGCCSSLFYYISSPCAQPKRLNVTLQCRRGSSHGHSENTEQHMYIPTYAYPIPNCGLLARFQFLFAVSQTTHNTSNAEDAAPPPSGIGLPAAAWTWRIFGWRSRASPPPPHRPRVLYRRGPLGLRPREWGWRRTPAAGGGPRRQPPPSGPPPPTSCPPAAPPPHARAAGAVRGPAVPAVYTPSRCRAPATTPPRLDSRSGGGGGLWQERPRRCRRPPTPRQAGARHRAVSPEPDSVTRSVLSKRGRGIDSVLSNRGRSQRPKCATTGKQK